MDKNTDTPMFHVHAVLDMIFKAATPMTAEEIKTKMADTFGATALFGSCSIQGMNPDQVMEFLFARKKLAEVEPGKYVLNMNNTCNH